MVEDHDLDESDVLLLDVMPLGMVSRNLASQYLNELVRDGLIVKVNARPVLFLHRRGLERYLQTTLDRSEYASMPVKKFYAFLIVGYVLSAYLGLTVLPIALLGGAVAIEYFRLKSSTTVTTAAISENGGELEDE